MITENDVEKVRNAVKERISDKRYEHTLGVERAVIYIGNYYMPERVNELRVAALLHDIAKELSPEDAQKTAEKYGAALTHDDILSPKTVHQIVSAAIAKNEFSEYVTDDIISAISKHCTGSGDMSIFDMILYVGDFIEDTRTYSFCIGVGKKFKSGLTVIVPKSYKRHIYEIMIFIIDYIVKQLIEDNRFVHPKTIAARNSILEELKKIYAGG